MLRKIREKLTCRKGFTLVELLAVVAIIGVLAAIAIPRYVNATKEAQTAQIQADLRSIDSAITLYMTANGGTPPAALTTLTQDTDYFAAEPAPPSGAYALDADGLRANWSGNHAEDRTAIRGAL